MNAGSALEPHYNPGNMDNDASGATGTEMVSVALDVMSGDESPRSRIRAALRALDKYPFLSLHLVGDQTLIESYLGDSQVSSAQRSRIVFVHAEKTVAMDEKPSLALRGKKDTSMWEALQQVANGNANACVSAGNTGALMAMGRFALKTFAGIDRPAIAVNVPTRKVLCDQVGSSLLLDVGANVDCTSMHLYQFAMMGAQLVSSLHGVKSPKVALLNVGVEEVKGNEQVRLAHHLLKERLAAQDGLDYIGFVEGHDLFSGKADVIVCDGFVGNIALKTTEGVASLIKDGLQQVFQQNLFTRLLYLLILPFFKDFNRRIDPVLHNGASFLGLQGTVIKSHGGADEKGFYKAICQAVSEAQNNVPQKLASQIEDMLV